MQTSIDQRLKLWKKRVSAFKDKVSKILLRRSTVQDEEEIVRIRKAVQSYKK